MCSALCAVANGRGPYNENILSIITHRHSFPTRSHCYCSFPVIRREILSRLNIPSERVRNNTHDLINWIAWKIQLESIMIFSSFIFTNILFCYVVWRRWFRLSEMRSREKECVAFFPFFFLLTSVSVSSFSTFFFFRNYSRISLDLDRAAQLVMEVIWVIE